MLKASSPTVRFPPKETPNVILKFMLFISKPIIGLQPINNFEINDQNPATDWWFQEGGVENIVAINPVISQSADLKSFMVDIISSHVSPNPTIIPDLVTL